MDIIILDIALPNEKKLLLYTVITNKCKQNLCVFVYELFMFITPFFTLKRG